MRGTQRGCKEEKVGVVGKPRGPNSPRWLWEVGRAASSFGSLIVDVKRAMSPKVKKMQDFIV